VLVLKYPQGGIIQKLSVSSPYEMCSDLSSGDVFITTVRSDEVIVYGHGNKTPKETLQTNGWALGCAVDPKTGNLAVAISSSSDGAGVEIFPKGSGSPKTFWEAKAVMWFCAYDDNGDLFVDGGSDSQRVALWELSPGGPGFVNVQINGGEFYDVYQLQWSSQYLTMEDVAFDTISRMVISSDPSRPGAAVATYEGKTSFPNCGYVKAAQSWIQESTLIVPCGPMKHNGYIVNLYTYPNGAKTKRIQRGLLDTQYTGVTVSVAPSGTRTRH
jgi:hypothetical protein